MNKVKTDADQLLDEIKFMIEGNDIESCDAIEDFPELHLLEKDPLTEFEDFYKTKKQPVKFYLPEKLPLVNLVFLLFLESENEKHLLEQRIDLTTNLGVEILEINHKTLKTDRDPSPIALLNFAVEAVAVGDIELAKDSKIEDENTCYSVVDTISFLRWFEYQDRRIDPEIVQAAKRTMERKFSADCMEREFETNFPQLKDDEFLQLQKEPLWTVRNAIIYMQNRKSNTTAEKEEAYIKSDVIASKLLEYIIDATNTGDLKLYQENSTTDEQIEPVAMLNMKIRPNEFVPWATELPLDLPVLVEQKFENHTGNPLPKYKTAEMEIMEEAVAKFWSHYDLSKPDPSMAYQKEEVMIFMHERAKAKNIKLSVAMVKQMDSIIRCSESRKGGNTR